jgi:hypothetical protein
LLLLLSLLLFFVVELVGCVSARVAGSCQSLSTSATAALNRFPCVRMTIHFDGMLFVSLCSRVSLAHLHNTCDAALVCVCVRLVRSRSGRSLSAHKWARKWHGMRDIIRSCECSSSWAPAGHANGWAARMGLVVSSSSSGSCCCCGLAYATGQFSVLCACSRSLSRAIRLSRSLRLVLEGA